MGMGDKPIPYVPHYEPIYDDVLRKMFSSSIMRSCPDEAVIKRYGTGGKAMVSVYVCKHCKHSAKHPQMGAWYCGLEQDLQSGAKSNMG